MGSGNLIFHRNEVGSGGHWGGHVAVIPAAFVASSGHPSMF